MIDWSVNHPMTTRLTDSDRLALSRALELAERGRGRVSPNPLVGAVLARDGQVIGEGFHAELGGRFACGKVRRGTAVRCLSHVD